ncbi:MAG: 50S ribosomal protein L3 N(5)-glutamine methyltransferase [Gammaproteobacteria bacterium]
MRGRPVVVNRRRRPCTNAREAVLDAERRFKRARLYFGHGTDNARDEAVFLVFHALGLPFDCPASRLEAPLNEAQLAAVESIVASRIARRCPAAYLTGRMWFAGHEFQVNEHVLVPRSPIAELVLDRFAPWYHGPAITRILDIGTGSGCIGIAAALAFPDAHVDATDVSPRALAVAARNVARHAVAARVHLHEADLFPESRAYAPYDLVLANPPYVPASERAELPDEYTHEPPLALFAEDEGLALIRRIIAGTAGRMARHGLLVLDAGGTWPAVDEAFRGLPITWVELAHGGDGIGVITQPDLERFALQ